jgi:hypothetical protein
MADVKPLVALETNQIGLECRCCGRGQRCLADARFTFEEQRPLQTKRQEQ